MDLSGNKELLDRYLVAFFASRTAPPEALDLAKRWAHEIAQTDKIVISGFHSPIERTVLDILLANGCSVVVALGRSLYRKIQRTCKRPMIAIGCCLYRSETTHAPHSPTLKSVIGSPPTSHRRLSLPHSINQANSRHYIIVLPIARHLAEYWNCKSHFKYLSYVTLI